MLLGPSLLGWIEPSQTFRLLAEIGINLLLFEVGLIFAELERVNDILVNNVYATTIIAPSLPSCPFVLRAFYNRYGSRYYEVSLQSGNRLDL